MPGTLTKDTLFKSTRSKSESKAATTTSAARAILDAEVAQREAKTARLREAREAMVAKELAEMPVKKATTASAARKKRK